MLFRNSGRASQLVCRFDAGSFGILKRAHPLAAVPGREKEKMSGSATGYNEGAVTN